MASVNKAIILGNLGRDPELRHTPGGKAVATLRIATNEVWTDQSGERQERTEWHTVVVWGRQAENCNQYLKKGRSVYIEGRLTTRKWQDKDGKDRYSTEIVADRVQFIGGGTGGGGGGGREFEDQSLEPPPPGGGGDDIPF
jgi:single-strand DNA-binding protein